MNKGFTLAEILLTLVIVGIIVSLTIPALISNINNQQYTSGFIRSYNLFNSAITTIMSNNSGTMLGAVNDTDDLINKFAEQLSIRKFCLNRTAPGNCFANSYYNLHLQNSFAPAANTYSGGILNDGTSFMITSWDTSCTANWFNYNGQNIMCARISIDTNGLTPPNVKGRDIFLLSITKIGLYPHLIPLGNNNQPTFSSGSWRECEPLNQAELYNGDSCAGRILQEGWKMNY